MSDNNTHRNVLIHEMGKESRIVVRDSGIISESDFFYSQYKQATSIVQNYCNAGDGKREFENNNNIVAFIGERGSGKTSCMLTFANLLTNDEKCGCDRRLSLEKVEWAGKYSFLKLRVIDPSFFSKSFNIVGSFLANIYDAFIELRKKDRNGFDKNTSAVNGFLESLSKTQMSYSALNSDHKNIGDCIEELESLSSTLRLKDDLFELTEKFLNLYGKGGDSKLVVCIDDIDLNTSSAVEMMEWIRKYLIQPNIVILMAIKLDQMTNLKRLNLYSEYGNMVNNQKMDEYEIEEMAERYMSKLIPLANRVYMPDDGYIPLSLYQLKGDDSTKQQVLRDVLVKTLFEKTRFHFYNSHQRSSLLVPRNLREALHLMRMLHDMEPLPWKDEITGLENDIKTKEDGTEIDELSKKLNEYREKRAKVLSNNQSLFKEYLYYDFMVRNLTSESRKYIEELLSVTDATQYNAEVLNVLRNKFSDVLNIYNDAKTTFTPKADPMDYELWNIFDKTNIAHNISMGDVLWVLDWLDNMERTNEESYFLFMVRVLYSMRLNDYYQQFVNSENQMDKNSESPESVLISNTKSEIKDKDNYLLLLAGQVFNPKLVDFIPENPKRKLISCGLIKLDEVKELSKNVKNYFDTGDPKDGLTELRLLEFLMLCTSRPTERKRDNCKYRKTTTPRYAVPFASSSQTAIFDINSFFTNILDIPNCYHKYDKIITLDLVGKILGSEESLWYSLLTASSSGITIDAKGFVSDPINRQWRKKVCMTNVEVYQHFANHLEGQRRRSESSKIVDKIAGFFRSVSDFKMQSFSGENALDYKFLSTILCSDDKNESKIPFISRINQYIVTDTKKNNENNGDNGDNGDNDDDDGDNDAAVNSYPDPNPESEVNAESE